MKKHISKILHSPKSLIPVFAIVVLGLTVYAYGQLGRAPIVPGTISETIPVESVAPGTNVSLSFANTGRVEAVLLKEGDVVKSGQVIARLSAPQAQGAVSQAKGALDLAEAEYASLKVEYSNTKKQQDLLVGNAHKTLLSGGLEGVPSHQDLNTPIITGTYSCGKEGSYILTPYRSGDNDSGYNIRFAGLEEGIIPVKYDNSIELGKCGLEIKFNHINTFDSQTIWTINIPNTKSSVYLENKNAYDLAVNTREKTLSDLETSLSENNTDGGVAKAKVDAARGAYQAALGAYQNNLIISPVNGVITFVDSNLKVGQSVASGKAVISISAE